MANKITQDEIIQKDIWENTIKSTKELIAQVDLLQAELKKVSEQSVKIVKESNKPTFENLKKSDEEIKKINTSFEQRITLDKERLKLEKQLATAKAKLALQNEKVVKDLAQEREALRKNNLLNRQIAKFKQTQVGTVENLRAKLSLVTTAWTKLTAAELENTKRGRRLVESKKNITAELKRLETATGDSRRNVGNYGSAIDRLKTSFKNLAGQVGLTFGILGAVRVLKGAFNTVREFELQNATLAGVLGVTRKETEALTKSQIEYGSTTEFTATQVGELQEAFARLGFSQQQILDVTEGTLNLSTALGSELGETAELVGSTLNAFGLEATESENVVNSLTRATQNSALNFQRLKESLGFVAPTAKTLGLSLEETTGLLGVLVDNGIKASRAGRLLSTTFLKLADEGKSLEEGLDEITQAQDEGKTALEVASVASQVFGKESAALGIILADNRDKVEELTASIQDNGNAAKDLAEEKLKTLDGSLKLLNSAWDGFILRLNDATQGGNILARGIRFLAENLTTVIKTVAVATSTFVAYRAATIASSIATRAAATVQALYSTATVTTTAATKAATTATKAFNAASKLNPFGLLIALATAAAAAYYAFNDAAVEAAAAQERLNESKKRGRDEQIQVNKDSQSLREQEIQALENDAKKRVLLNEDSKKVALDLLKSKVDIYERDRKLNIIAQAEAKDEIKNREEIAKRNLKLLEEQKKRASKNVSFTKSGRIITTELDRIQSNIDKISGNVDNQTAELTERLKVLVSEGDLISKGIADLTTETEVAVLEKNNKDLGEAIKRAKNLEALQRRLQDLRDQSIVDDQEREIAQINRKYDREIAAITGNSQVEQDLRAELDKTRFAQLEELNASYYKKQLDANLEAIEKEKQAIKEAEEATIPDFDEEPEAFDDETEAFLKSQKEKAAKEIELREKTLATLTALNNKYFNDRNAKLDEEIEAQKKRETELQNLAAQGNEEAAKGLADNQKEQAEANRKKEVLAQRERQFETALALIQAFNSNLDAGDSSGEALAKAVTSVSVLTSLASSLPSFYDGTEDTGTVANPLDSNGGRLSVLHDNERVVDRRNNDKMKGLTNNELADIAEGYKSGLLLDATAINTPNVLLTSPYQSNEQLIKKVEHLEKSIVSAINNKETYLGSDVDTVKKIVSQRFEKGSTKKTIKSKVNIW